MTTTTNDVVNQLPNLADQINAEHEACLKSASIALDHAMRAGDLLAEAKAAVPHGKWQDWLAEHFAGSSRTARAYMRLAEHREAIEAKRQRSATLPIGEALRLIAAPRVERWYPRESDDPAVLRTDPDAWEELYARLDEYRANAAAYLQEIAELTERATEDDIPRLAECIREANKIQNGWAYFVLKTQREMGRLFTELDEQLGDGFSNWLVKPGNYGAFLQACEERIAELRGAAEIA